MLWKCKSYIRGCTTFDRSGDRLVAIAGNFPDMQVCTGAISFKKRFQGSTERVNYSAVLSHKWYELPSLMRA